MTNKERYIKAMENTIEKHTNFKNNTRFMDITSCDLCIINKVSSKNTNCGTCIYNNNSSWYEEGVGCKIIFANYKHLLYLESYAIILEAMAAVSGVVPRLERHLAYIKTLPEKRFTKRGWKPFKLDEIK